MTDNNHPITPPPELFAEWLAEAKRLHPDESLGFISGQIAQLAYRAGADMELEACCEWVSQWRCMVGGNRPEIGLRAARRPKPPSLKELAMKALDEAVYMADDIPPEGISTEQADIIRRALEALPE